MSEPGISWRVELEDRDGTRWWHPIAAAIGPADARNQAKLDVPDATPLRAQPFLCDGCQHPANSHDASTGRCNVAYTSGDETYSCDCRAGYVPGRSPERLYPGERARTEAGWDDSDRADVATREQAAREQAAYSLAADPGRARPVSVASGAEDRGDPHITDGQASAPTPEPFAVDLLPAGTRYLDALDHVDAEAKEWLVERRGTR